MLTPQDNDAGNNLATMNIDVSNKSAYEIIQMVEWSVMCKTTVI